MYGKGRPGTPLDSVSKAIRSRCKKKKEKAQPYATVAVVYTALFKFCSREPKTSLNKTAHNWPFVVSEGRIHVWGSQPHCPRVWVIEAVDGGAINFVPPYIWSWGLLNNRLDNLIFDGDSEKVLAVLDWELSTIGDPLTDLATSAMPYYLPPGE